MKTSRCGRCGQPIPDDASYICAGCFAHSEGYEDWLIDLLEQEEENLVPNKQELNPGNSGDVPGYPG